MGTFHHQPQVLEDVALESFMQYLLDYHGSGSMLIVCSSKEVFLQQLQAAISRSAQSDASEDTDGQADAGQQPTTAEPLHSSVRSQPHRWTMPTLRLLASAQTLKIAFCENVTHLRAYLAAYGYQNAPEARAPGPISQSASSMPLLAILNLISLHRPTSNFSAQGLNRTFSIAVDAAHESESKLVIAECNASSPRGMEVPQLPSIEEASPVPSHEHKSVWDEEVSILNVATKTFGAGERGWVGRTVKLRAVASRWCVFERRSDGGD